MLLMMFHIYEESSVVSGVVESLKSSGLLRAAGIATSLKNSGQQWYARTQCIIKISRFMLML